jgi:geranylgeranyl transferase type-2 subunit beta
MPSRSSSWTVAQYIESLQQANGSFAGDAFSEEDLKLVMRTEVLLSVNRRYTFCSVLCLHLLDRMSTLNDPLATTKYINDCRNVDGGFGMNPGSESHGGLKV